MPLHLLGKKSWNVYNQENIDRVRRDEDEARVQAQRAERQRRDEDAAERLNELRGDQTSDRLSPSEVGGRRRKRSRDDAECTSQRWSQGPQNQGREERVSDARIPQIDRISNTRLKDAAGRHPDAQKPWYTSSAASRTQDAVGRDVWGNEDAGRKARDQVRLDASDPLLAMKRGVRQLRDVERQKAEWRQEREKDLNEVEILARVERRSRRRDGREKHRHRHDSGRHEHHKRSRRDARARSRSPQRPKNG